LAFKKTALSIHPFQWSLTVWKDFQRLPRTEANRKAGLHAAIQCNAGWSRVLRIGRGAAAGTMLPGKKVRLRSNPAGLRVDASSLAFTRWSAVAMSARSPALSQRTREGQGTRFLVR
jgi:hypothetical protein